jgi:hypothetical protein
MNLNLRLGLVAAGLWMATVLDAARAQSPPEAGWSELVPKVAGARDYYVAADGKSTNPGTLAAPWNLASALAGQHKIAPGDAIWVRGGKYQEPLKLMLAGKPGAPIHVRAYPGERATILDSTLFVGPPSQFVWIWDLEITTTITPQERVIKESGSHPQSLPRRFRDGININHTDSDVVYSGLKFIDLVIHDTLQGISFWVDAVDSEVHGCLIHENGWNAPDRGHGHCIYTQNRNGVKTISNCIMSAKFDGAYTIHAYGSDHAYVDNYVVEDNIAYQNGPVLVGGGRPSHDIKILHNYLYGVSMRTGYGARQNEDCEVRDNIIAKGTLRIDRYKDVVQEGNSQTVVPEHKAVVILNKYDPNRAHLAVYNGAKSPKVTVDVSTFLKPGERFRLLNPRDVFGEPVLSGTCEGSTIALPMQGEFAPFVLLKGR